MRGMQFVDKDWEPDRLRTRWILAPGIGYAIGSIKSVSSYLFVELWPFVVLLSWPSP